MKPVPFKTPAAFRRWLKANHASVRELWVKFYRKDSGKTGISYAQALDEALCYGWIDGIRKKVDDESYTNRFTPRQPRSVWSTVNVARVGALKATGRMTAVGLRAFERRDPAKTANYSYERETSAFDPDLEHQFRATAAAWTFFLAQPPGYRRLATWFVVSAKKPETRAKRLAALIDQSARGRRLL